MTKKLFIYVFSFSFLSLACAEDKPEKQNGSEQLQISWKPQPNYHYYFYIQREGTSLSGKSDYHFSNQESSITYPWTKQNIYLYGIALDKRAADYGIYPERNPEGKVDLKISGQTTAPTENNLLLTSSSKIETGKAETQLLFVRGMSLLCVNLESASDYQWDIQLEAIKDGYIDLQEGKVIPQGQETRIYFSTSNKSVTVIPQTLSSNAKLYITGISTTGSILKTNFSVANQKLESGKQYTWNFIINSGKLTFKNLSETEWH